MARYIDAERLKRTFASGIRVYNGMSSIYDVIHNIENEPTADVEEVVRCKDCNIPHNKWTGCPKLNGLIPPPNFFCGYGERRKK